MSESYFEFTIRAACAHFSVARRSASWISARSVEPHCGFAASISGRISLSGPNPPNARTYVPLRSHPHSLPTEQHALSRFSTSSVLGTSANGTARSQACDRKAAGRATEARRPPRRTAGAASAPSRNADRCSDRTGRSRETAVRNRRDPATQARSHDRRRRVRCSSGHVCRLRRGRDSW